jgi:hypothetical protein
MSDIGDRQRPLLEPVVFLGIGVGFFVLDGVEKPGEPGWYRTNDLLIKSQLLYH